MNFNQGDGTGFTGFLLMFASFMQWLNENSDGVSALISILGFFLLLITTIIKIRLWYKYKDVKPNKGIEL